MLFNLYMEHDPDKLKDILALLSKYGASGQQLQGLYRNAFWMYLAQGKGTAPSDTEAPDQPQTSTVAVPAEQSRRTGEQGSASRIF